MGFSSGLLLCFLSLVLDSCHTHHLKDLTSPLLRIIRRHSTLPLEEKVKPQSLLMAKAKNAPRSRASRRRRAAGSGALDAHTTTVPASGGMIIRRRATGPVITTRIGRNPGHHVRNCERIFGASTAALGAFISSRVFIYPGVFPWLLGPSQSFSKYKFHFLKFIYIPISTSTQAGHLCLGLGYDGSDLAPTSMQLAQQAHKAVTAPIWAGFNGSDELSKFSKDRGAGSVSIVVDVDKLGGPSGQSYFKTISSGNFNILSTQDRNFYSGVYLDISLEGGSTGIAAAGHVFAEYDVELIEPIAPSVNQ